MKKLKSKFIPLDIVETKLGSIAIVTQISNTRNIHFNYSVYFIKENEDDFNAWHEEDELKYINNLYFMFIKVCHNPFNGGLDLTQYLEQIRKLEIDSNPNY